MVEIALSKLSVGLVDYVNQGSFLSVLVIVLGWGFGFVLGMTLSKMIPSKVAGSICMRFFPLIGVVAAFPLAYKLMFFA